MKRRILDRSKISRKTFEPTQSDINTDKRISELSDLNNKLIKNITENGQENAFTQKILPRPQPLISGSGED